MSPAPAAAAGWRGLILAGGQSTRMGRDKAMLEWRGRPLLAHMRERLLDAGAAQVVISGAYPGYGGIADPAPGGGPLAALAQLAPRLADARWLVVPVDMPRLDAALIAALLATPAYCAHCAGHPLPMQLRLDAGSRPILRRIGDLPSSQRSLRALQQALHAVEIDAAHWRMQLLNCNTPAEWRRFVEDGPESG